MFIFWSNYSQFPLQSECSVNVRHGEYLINMKEMKVIVGDEKSYISSGPNILKFFLRTSEMVLNMKKWGGFLEPLWQRKRTDSYMWSTDFCMYTMASLHTLRYVLMPHEIKSKWEIFSCVRHVSECLSFQNLGGRGRTIRSGPDLAMQELGPYCAMQNPVSDMEITPQQNISSLNLARIR